MGYLNLKPVTHTAQCIDYILYNPILGTVFRASCDSLIWLQIFLALLARDYEWDCDAHEKWVNAENVRYTHDTCRCHDVYADHDIYTMIRDDMEVCDCL